MKLIQYLKPENIAEALASATKHSPDYLFFGGGTDIQIYLKQQLIAPHTIIDLSAIKDLQEIKLKQDNLKLGAMVTLHQIINNQDIKQKYPLLCRAAKAVATPVVRRTATIGGNLLVKNRCTFYNQAKAWRQAVGSCLRDQGNFCQVTGGKNACFSRNVSDTATALIALGARVYIRGPEETSEFPLEDLYLPDGLLFHRQILNDSILSEIEISQKTSSWWFKKLRLRKSLDFMSLAVAATIDTEGRARICLNGVSMSPVLIEGKIKDMSLKGLIAEALKLCKTVDNDLMPLKYRRLMINTYLKMWWETTVKA